MTQYFRFDGLATRSEYWGVYILAFILLVILLITGTVLIGAGESLELAGILVLVGSIIANVWLTLSVTVRRCRDAGINPWWTAACYVPYLGVIPWIIIGCLKADDKA
jgi:uncharacterized membrane protein YhaH (DUF805 family)